MYGGFWFQEESIGDGATRFMFFGELDLAHRDEASRALLTDHDGRKVVVDTTELDFIDSTGLGILMEARNRFGPDGFTLIPGDATLKVLEVTGTKQHLLDDE